MSSYFDFMRTTVETLLEKQSARLGGKADGPVCITITRQTNKTSRSLGGRVGDTYRSFLMEEQPMEMEPYRMDLGSWVVLDHLSDVTGDGRYSEMVDGMVEGIRQHGFDPASGLGYLGVQAEFDVLRLEPVPAWGYTEATFKPGVNIPLDRLRAGAGEELARMFKLAYHGLITRPENMDYNRYCSYGFDDSEKKPSMEFNSHHVAFGQTGAMLIHWWAYHFARTGDPECLAVQNPETGLMSHWFGSDRSGEPTQPARSYANSGETMTGVSLLWVARELSKRSEGTELADKVDDMAYVF